MVAEASATRSASDLVAEAMAKVESGSAAHMHLTAAADALEGASGKDAVEKGSQLVSVPIDEKRPLPLTLLTALPSRPSERSSDTILLSQLERLIEEKLRIHPITITLPSP